MGQLPPPVYVKAPMIEIIGQRFSCQVAKSFKWFFRKVIISRIDFSKYSPS